MTLSQMEIFRHPRKPAKDIADLKPIAETSTGRPTMTSQPSFGSTVASSGPAEIFTTAATSLDGPSTSAATSFKDESGTSSPDLFPTQDVMEIDADENFKTSFTELCDLTKADVLFNKLCDKTPFKKADLSLPHKVSFRHRYELQRVADALHTTPEQLLRDFRRMGISSSDDYDTFWATGRAIAKERGHLLPERSSSSAWNCASDSFFENETGKKSVYLGGALKFNSSLDEGLFNFELKPLVLDKSCRFHRKYGPSRFMVLSVPSLSADIPKKLEEATSGVLTTAFARWLATEHRIFGRKWRAFFVDREEKRKSKAKTPAPGYKVNLFAVSGEDLPAKSVIEVQNFLNWHIPIEHNLQSTNLKLFQRLKLGLSKTVSTFPLNASEFIRLPDPVNHAVMNDGCARMSMTLAKNIARHIGLTEVPSVFQGRISGAKGLWMAVPDHDFQNIGKRNYCIEIADSQLKIHPHPKDNLIADEAQRTFEVSEYAGPGKPAALNIQLLTILDDRQVPREVLGELLVADISTFPKDLEESMRAPLRLLSWVQSSGLCSRGEEDIRMTGSWPDDVEEQTIMLIENGFTPESNSFLRECLRTLLTKYLTRYVEGLQIRVPCSTYLFCIPDPYGVLEPNEVHLSFSEVWKDPISGFKESFVDGRDVLVARMPALLPSDIQRRQAVWKRELHQFKDVIVFSTKGTMPLAHMLSGGDYDGDRPWICWDLDIVKHFENADLPQMPSKADCGMVQQSRKITDVFSGRISSQLLASQISNFFVGCFAFNLNTPYLGQCTIEHEKVVYFDGNLSAPNAIKLAALCGYLVDSAKQGDLLPTSAWLKLRRQVSPHKLGNPAYKDEKCETRKRESNIIDFLKFRQAVPEMERILTQFGKNWPQHTSKDSTLCEPWNTMKNLSRCMDSTPELPRILCQLEKDVKQVADDFDRQRPKGNWADDFNSQGPKGNWPPGQFRQSMERACDQFRAIKHSEFDQKFSHLWTSEGDKRFGHWSLLRASCIYNICSAWTTVWYLAGEELCHIKAQAAPDGYRTVVKSVYPALKCNSKIAKKVQQRLDEADFEDDTFGWEDIGRVIMMEEDE